MRYFLIASLLCLLSTLAAAPLPRDPDPHAVAEQGTIVPAGVPLKVRLIAHETVYRLDRGGLSETAYIVQLQRARKGEGQLPAAPRVDLVFELENAGAKEVQLLVGGDISGVPRLHLEGPGAVNITHRSMAQADDLKAPLVVKLAPGGKQRWTFRDLDSSGPRDQSRAYWTRAGEYQLSVGVTVAMRPAPQGAVPHWYHKDHGNVAIKSGAVRLIVLDK